MSYLVLLGSVLLGVLLVLLMKPNKNITRLLLAFSGAYLLSVTVLHLLPEVYEHSTSSTIGILILSGLILQFLLESFSKGAEHGHVHIHSDGSGFPILLFFSLSIHALTEGLPIHHAGENLLWAIAVHKIPIAVVLTTFFVNSNYSKTKIILFLVAFAMMTPLGVFLSEKVPFIMNHITEVTAVIIGVFLHISTVILFESTENHKFNIQKFAAILLGIILTIATL